MYLTLVSVILSASLAMTQGHVAVPSPLAQMAHALATAHSYRVVFTSAQSLNGVEVTTSTTVVRHGKAVQTDTATTRTVPGHQAQLLDEQVVLGARTCDRLSRTASWHCAPPASRSDLALLAQNSTLKALHWTRLAAAKVQGQLCRGYQTTWRPSSDVQTRAVLWIGQSNRPVALTATTTSTAGAGRHKRLTTIRETLTWSAWNSATLRIPTV